MAITAIDLLLRWPEFNALDEDPLNLFIADAYEFLDPAIWESKLDKGALYLAAHMAKLSMSSGMGASGPVQSESVGQVRRSYAVAVATEGDTYEYTGYGRSFLALLMTLPNARVAVSE